MLLLTRHPALSAPALPSASSPSPSPFRFRPIPCTNRAHLCFHRRISRRLLGGLLGYPVQPLPQRGRPRGTGALRHQVALQPRRRAGLPRLRAGPLPSARRRRRGARPGGTHLQRAEDAGPARGRAPRARLHHFPDGPHRRARRRGRVPLARPRPEGPVLAPVPPRPRRQARRRAQDQPGHTRRGPPDGQAHRRAAPGGRHPHRRRRRLVRHLLLLQAAHREPRRGRRRPGPRRRIRRAAQDAIIAAFSATPERLAWKAAFFRDELGWTEAQVKTAAAKMPTLMTVSAERLRRNWEFLNTEVGMDAERVASFPALLRYDLEGRLVPRFRVMRVLQERRLWRGRDFNNIAAITEDFVAKFIRPFLVKVRNLAKVYEAAIAKEEQ